jgi:hypothetical protein
MHGGNKQSWEFEVEGNDAVIAFPSTLTLGWYGLEMSGTYNDEGWRWCVPDVFQIVETNMKANVPSWTVLTDDTYMVNGVLTLASGGGGAPIDAYTKAQTDALLAEKVNTEYSGERFRAKYSDQIVEFMDLDLLGEFYCAAYSAYGINLHYNDDTGHIRYDGKLKVNDEAVAMASDLAGKQDTINDLVTIRSGAAAGATAVQPSELVPINTTLGEVENALTEEVAEIADVEDDASGQADGTWIRPQSTPHISFTRDMQANTITSQTIDGVSYSSGVSFGVYNQYDILHISSGGSVVFYVIGNSTYYRSPNIRVAVKYQGDASFTTVKTVNLPTTSYGIKFSIEVTGECDIALYYFASGSAQPTYTMGLLVRIDYNVSAFIDVSEVKDDVHANSNAIATIEQKIPAQASSSNQLADKGFVNSSIATATATYRGSYNLVSDLSLSVSATQQQIADALATKMEALSITPDNNDYCFVQVPTADATPTEIARIDRYKYDGTAWAYEYSLNNSSFTAAQWAALNSGITSGLVGKLSDLPTATELATLLASKASTQQLAGKEDITPIVAVESGTTALTAEVNKYYEVAGTVSSLTVTLPTPTANTEVTMVVVHLTVGASPTVVVTSVNEVVKFSAAYSVVANKEYELSCLYNGSKWIVSSMEVAI